MLGKRINLSREKDGQKIDSCAFTGPWPRNLPWGYDEAVPGCISLKKSLREEIESLVEAGAATFLSGMAEGVDTWAALIVLELREKNPALRLHCILPCKGQADRWSAPARERYVSILVRADEITCLSRGYTKTCMLERNRFLVDHAEALLAVYGGEERSGTAATVRYARKTGKMLRILYPGN